jgi:hypothetical protein
VTFQEMGAGSIMLVDTIRVIDQTFGVRIKAQRFFEDLATLDAFATYLAGQAQSPSPLLGVSFLFACRPLLFVILPNKMA